MALITKPYTFSPSTTIRSAEMNANLDTLYNKINGNINPDNININASLNFGSNQALNLLLEVLTANPTPLAGRLWYKGGTAYYSDGAALIPMTGPELFPYAGTGLNLNYLAGRVSIDGTIYEISASSRALTPSATNYVFVDNTGAVSHNTSSFPDDSFPIATAVTGASAITSVADKRNFVARSPSPLGGKAQKVEATSAQTTTSTTYVDLDTTTPLSFSYTPLISSNPVEIEALLEVQASAADVITAIIAIDGTTQANSERKIYIPTANQPFQLRLKFLTTLTVASHSFKVQWKVGTGTTTATCNLRTLAVVEHRKGAFVSAGTIETSYENGTTLLNLRPTSTLQVKLAMRFQVTGQISIQKIQLKLNKLGAPAGNIWVTVETDAGTGNAPSGTVVSNGTSATIGTTGIPNADQWAEFTFTTSPVISGSTNYWIVLQGDYTFSSTNHIRWLYDVNVGTYALGFMAKYDGTSWAALGTADDAQFRVYRP